MYPFPDVESGSETEREARSVYKVQGMGVATRSEGWERVEEAGQSSAMAACSGSSDVRLHGGRRDAEKAEVGRVGG